MDNSESNLPHKANETTYYVMDSVTHKQMIEKHENEKRNKKPKWPFWLGLTISFMQPLLFLLSKTIICNGKQEYECAYSAFGALVVAVFLFTFGVLFSIYSWLKYTKNHNAITQKSIIILAIRCLLGTILMLLLYPVVISVFFFFFL